MYESEVYQTVVDAAEIPVEVRAQFAAFGNDVARRSSLPWGEHCSECAWPTCYENCSLYTPRADLKCQRFLDGVVRINFENGVMPYLLKITFKRWAKLYAVASATTEAADTARAAEVADLRRSRFLRLLPGSAKSRIRRIRRRYVEKRDSIVAKSLNGSAPSHFAIECYNPNDAAVNLTVTMAPMEGKRAIPFEHRMTAAQGYNRLLIDIAEIAQRVDFARPFHIEIAPNLDGALRTLYFGCVDFVVLRRGAAPEVPSPSRIEAQEGSKKVKCVIWDLDNTVWEGTLIEDGIDALTLKPGIREIIVELDNRGILHSVASKNNYDEAMEALQRFGLAEYFLYPQISWNPKSIAVQRIAKSIDIGLDTFLFVDDSEFERAEVSETVPDVRVLDAADLLSLPALHECNVPVTAESGRRRILYMKAQERDTLSEQFEGDFEGFLRSCNLRIYIRPLNAENLQRVHELTQRTNQMNFSGNRYTIGFLEKIMGSADYGTFVIDCEDRFGSYGIIGFCIVRDDEPRMTDLMFSCRIQNKRVDHAVLRFAMDKYRRQGCGAFYADFRRTDRNAAGGKLFDDFGFVELGEKDGILDLAYPADKTIEDDGIVEILEPKPSEQAA